MTDNDRQAMASSQRAGKERDQEWLGLTRTLKDGLERGIQRKIDPEAAVLPWVIAHAASVLNKFAVGADGRTPTEKNE